MYVCTYIYIFIYNIYIYIYIYNYNYNYIYIIIYIYTDLPFFPVLICICGLSTRLNHQWIPFGRHGEWGGGVEYPNRQWRQEPAGGWGRTPTPHPAVARRLAECAFVHQCLTKRDYDWCCVPIHYPASELHLLPGKDVPPRQSLSLVFIVHSTVHFIMHMADYGTGPWPNTAFSPQGPMAGPVDGLPATIV